MIELLLQAERALAVGLLDQAERLYRQASDQDPRNAIAVVGLARVALERGDEVLALAEGRRALAIDPDNATASRLVQRLEEIMRFRGQPVPPPPALGGAPDPADRATPGPMSPAADVAAPAPPARTPMTDGTLAAPEAAAGAGSGEPPGPRPPGEAAARKRRSLLGRLLRRR